jgi:hypothetical protein
MITRILSGIGIAVLVSGCMTLPTFEGVPPGPNPNVGPTVSEVVKHIQCEIKKLLDDKTGAFAKFQNEHYFAAAVLTLEVTDSQSFAPSTNVVEPLLKAGMSRVVVLGGKLEGAQRRTMNFSFNLDLGSTKPDTDKCTKLSSGEGGIKGDLGLREIVLSGLASIDDLFYPIPEVVVGDAKPLSIVLRPAFGSTVEFTLTRSIGGGPTFTLTYFRGPGVGGNLLNAGKISKDTLVIAFAGIGPPKPPKSPTDPILELFKRPDHTTPAKAEQAVRNAQEQVQRMILQRLIPQ